MKTAEYVETNVAQRLDRLPWSRWHWLVVLALGITWILDGLEVTLVSALGGILKEPTTLGLTDAEIGTGATCLLGRSGYRCTRFWLRDGSNRPQEAVLCHFDYLSHGNGTDGVFHELFHLRPVSLHCGNRYLKSGGGTNPPNSRSISAAKAIVVRSSR